jgi:phosphoribosylformimino-5-aminoimidazole carboxamide ribotide isomerase
VKVIGVIDLLDGLAVHAVAGHRDRYQPIVAVAGTRFERGDAVAVARTYIQELGIDELYVADLDAILTSGHRSHDHIIECLGDLGVPLWIDAAVSSASRATHVHALGCDHVVVGLETLPSFDALRQICDVLDGKSVAFSLDLRDGRPLRTAGVETAPGNDPCAPARIAESAAKMGIGALIVLDLAKVGLGCGVDLELLRGVGSSVPGVTLLAGGGVHDVVDLRRLACAGCDGALVATALHQGRIGRADVMLARQLSRLVDNGSV